MISAEAARAHGFLARISRTRSISGGSRFVPSPPRFEPLDAQAVGDGERGQVVLELRGRSSPRRRPACRTSRACSTSWLRFCWRNFCRPGSLKPLPRPMTLRILAVRLMLE